MPSDPLLIPPDKEQRVTMTTRFTTRSALAASAAALAVTGSVAAAVVLTGGSSAAALPAHRVATEVVAAPVTVQLPARRPAPAAVTPAARSVAVRAQAKAAPSPVAAKAAPKAAPKPAPVTAPKAAPTPAATVAAAPKPVAAAPAPKAGGDDYPWRTSAGTANDTWGFTQRQCVSFAAFRLAQHGDTIDNSQGWGSALHWDETARARGVAVSSTPRVGAIAQWNAGEGSTVAGGGRFTAGSYGHVGYVAAVYSDGTALVEQYNLGGDRSYTALRMTAPRYLLF